MLNLSTTQARRRFSEIVTGAAHKGQRVMLTHYGKPVAAVIPIEDLRRLETSGGSPTKNGTKNGMKNGKTGTRRIAGL